MLCSDYTSKTTTSAMSTISSQMTQPHLSVRSTSTTTDMGRSEPSSSTTVTTTTLNAGANSSSANSLGQICSQCFGGYGRYFNIVVDSRDLTMLTMLSVQKSVIIHSMKLNRIDKPSAGCIIFCGWQNVRRAAEFIHSFIISVKC